MMLSHFDVSNKDLEEIFVQTAYKLGIGSPIIIEKDFWLVFILKILFTNKEFSNVHVFKGGTSLSKCFSLINRFSEDVDVTISKVYLGFNQNLDEVSSYGSKKRKKYFDELLQSTIKHINKLKNYFKKELCEQVAHENWQLYVDPEDHQKIIFEYPRVLNDSMYSGDMYVKPKILLEFGCRGDLEPSLIADVNAYVHQAYQNIFTNEKIKVRTLSADRTFWEKVTLLHMLANQSEEKHLNPRMARHYYDVVKLFESSDIKVDLNNIELLKHVAKHKMTYFRSKQASYETAVPGTIKLIPKSKHLKELEHDYRNMEEMFYDDILTFDKITSEIKKLESKLNNI